MFAGLEWGSFTNFESSSLTLTSVVLILPLGSLAAQRLARSASSKKGMNIKPRHTQRFLTTPSASSTMPLNVKPPSFITSALDTIGNGPSQVSILSICEATCPGVDHVNHYIIDGDDHPGTVRVDRDIEQRIQRV